MKSILFVLVLLSGCAHGTDGLRQSCADTDAVITGGYQAVVGWYHSDQIKIRALAADGAHAAAQAKLTADETATKKILDALDAAVSAKRAVCDLIPAIDAGLSKDVPTLIAQVLKVADDVRQALAQLVPLLTSERWRAIARTFVIASRAVV